jgi:hypothetical protein
MIKITGIVGKKAERSVGEKTYRTIYVEKIGYQAISVSKRTYDNINKGDKVDMEVISKLILDKNNKPFEIYIETTE